MSRAYYNEWDPYGAQWIRNLVAAGHVPPGDVDERSIADVAPEDLRGYTQVHFFSGIAGWGYAARLAGWPDDRPLWTGSCPCQPFSSAGLRKGSSDERHLWPELRRLVAGSRPPVLMGEQVADAAGRGWLDGVCTDLEDEGYAVGASFLPAAGVDAPHERNRIWFVAHPDGGDRDRRADLTWRGEEERTPVYRPRKNARAWDGAIWTPDHLGVQRRTPPGVRLLGDGIPFRVERLRAYANAVVPQLAAEVIAAYMDCCP